jgi:hypothetical protein
MIITWRATHLGVIVITGVDVGLNVDTVILVDLVDTVWGGKLVVLVVDILDDVDTDDDVETELDVDTLETKRRIV